MSLLFNMLSRLVITFLPRSKHLLIPWLLSPSAVILEPPKIKSSFQWEMFKNPVFTKQTFCKSFSALIQLLAVLLNKQVRWALLPTKSPNLLRDAF